MPADSALILCLSKQEMRSSCNKLIHILWQFGRVFKIPTLGPFGLDFFEGFFFSFWKFGFFSTLQSWFPKWMTKLYKIQEETQVLLFIIITIITIILFFSFSCWSWGAYTVCFRTKCCPFLARRESSLIKWHSRKFEIRNDQSIKRTAWGNAFPKRAGLVDNFDKARGIVTITTFIFF